MKCHAEIGFPGLGYELRVILFTARVHPGIILGRVIRDDFLCTIPQLVCIEVRILKFDRLRGNEERLVA